MQEGTQVGVIVHSMVIRVTVNNYYLRNISVTVISTLFIC